LTAANPLCQAPLGLARAGVATLAAGSVLPRSVAAQTGGTVRINMATDTQQLDRHLVTAWNDYCPWESIFSSLTALDRDFQSNPFVWWSTSRVSGFYINSQSRSAR